MKLVVWLRELFIGGAIGVANIIPGVSGGTFALILGVYERLIGFINRLSPDTLREVASSLAAFLLRPASAERRARLGRLLADGDWYFVARVGFGALLCVGLLSDLMKYLLEHHLEYTFSFFFGLILVSFAIPYRMLGKKGWREGVFLLLGLALTLGVTVAVDPAEKTLGKSEVYQTQYHSKSEVGPKSEEPVKKFSYLGKYTAREYVWISIAGMVAISAMVLPGISGSLVLILLGQYFTVLAAISSLRKLYLDDFLFLGVMSFGMLLGIVVISRLIEAALRRYHDVTIAFLLGLIAGSLWALWPFKRFTVTDLYARVDGIITVMPHVKVYTNENIAPRVAQLPVSLLLFLFGCGVMLFFVKKEAGPSPSSRP